MLTSAFGALLKTMMSLRDHALCLLKYARVYVKRFFVTWPPMFWFIVVLINLDVGKPYLKLQNLKTFIFILYFKFFKTLIYQNNILRNDSIHPPKFDFGNEFAVNTWCSYLSRSFDLKLMYGIIYIWFNESIISTVRSQNQCRE